MRVKVYGNDACFSRSAIIIFYLSIGWETWPPPAQTLLSTFQWLKESLDSQIQGKKKKSSWSRTKWPSVGQWPSLEQLAITRDWALFGET